MHNRYNDLRFSIVTLGLIICLLSFVFKLVFIQVFHSDYLSNLAEKQHNHLIEIEPIRGTIYDRNMRPLALNVTVYSLFVNPKQISEENKKQALQFLPSILDIPQNYLQELLYKNKGFVWLKRKMTLDEVNQVKGLKIKGLDFMT